MPDVLVCGDTLGGVGACTCPVRRGGRCNGRQYYCRHEHDEYGM